MYASNGTLIGIYNTTTKAICLESNVSYTFLIVPANENLLGNHPQEWFQSFIDKMQDNAVTLIIACFILMMLAIGASRLR